MKGQTGRGQPLSLTLSFGDILWFDVRGGNQHCDWFKRTHSLKIHAGHIRKMRFSTNRNAVIHPVHQNHRISPINDSVSDSA